MIEKVGTIKNPLTIIAIFAGIAEISGTAVLPFVVPANQSIYIWFLIFFPIFLVSIFFATLNFNHRVLYAPSDYQNEENFVKSFRPVTSAEKVKKLEKELAELEEGEKQQNSTEAVAEKADDYAIVADKSGDKIASFEDKKILFIRTEDQILDSLEKEYSKAAFREVRFVNTDHIFDGAIYKSGMLVLIEIKMLTYTLGLSKLQKMMSRLDEAITRMDRNKNPHIHLVLAFAIHGRGALTQESKAQIEIYQHEKSYSIEVKYFDFHPTEK